MSCPTSRAWPVASPLLVRHRTKLYEKALRELVRVETRLAGGGEGVTTWGTSSTAYTAGAPSLRPAVVRWDPRAPLGLRNAVLMYRDEAARHVREVREVYAREPIMDVRAPLEHVWGTETVALVERRWKEADALFAWAL